MIRLHFSLQPDGWQVSGDVPRGCVRAVTRVVNRACRLAVGRIAGRGGSLSHRQATQVVADAIRGVEVQLAPLGYDVWLTAAPGR